MSCKCLLFVIKHTFNYKTNNKNYISTDEVFNHKNPTQILGSRISHYIIKTTFMHYTEFDTDLVLTTDYTDTQQLTWANRFQVPSQG